MNYYNSVLRTLGGAAKVKDAIRMFMVPGMGHCSGGDGPNTFDMLTALGNFAAWCASQGCELGSSKQAVLDTITGLSAPGSALATEYVPGMADFDAEKARARTQPMRDMGLDIDMASLVYPGARNHVLDYLAKTGWHVAGFPRDELYVASGLEVPEPRDDDPIGEVIYVRATLD